MTSGTTFTTTVDGGFARDLRVFNGTAEEIADANFFGKNVFDAANSPSQGLVTVSQDSGNSAYAGAFGSPTSIIPGGQWLDVVLYVSPTETSYYINGIPIYSKTSSTPLGNLFLGYMDMNSGISPLGSNTWAVYTDYQVLVIPEPTTLAVVAGVFAMALRRRRA